MNIIQIDSGSENDHVNLPFINAQPNHIKGKRYLYIFKRSAFVDYIVAECISSDIDIRVKPLYGKRVKFKKIYEETSINR